MHTDIRVQGFNTPENVLVPREYFVKFYTQAEALF